jgi:GT2 family glycosyltransferase
MSAALTTTPASARSGWPAFAAPPAMLPSVARSATAAPSAAPDVSVVIVSFNTCAVLRECLLRLQCESRGLHFETIVVDNASRDASAAMVRKDFPDVQLIESGENLGFGAANNVGFRAARGRYIVLLNSDAFLRSRSLLRAVRFMDATPAAGLAGARLVGQDGAWQPSARVFPSLVNDLLILSGLSAKYPRSRFFGRPDRTWADAHKPSLVDWVPGAFAIVRRETLAAVGDFDERFFLYYEEVDLCRRIKAAGYEIHYRPEVVVVHLGGESSKTQTQLALQSSGTQLALWRMRSAFLYYRKSHGALRARAAYAMESAWHRLRAFKNRAGATAQAQAKRDESRRLLLALRKAWTDTRGGRVAPPRPW